MTVEPVPALDKLEAAHEAQVAAVAEYLVDKIRGAQRMGLAEIVVAVQHERHVSPGVVREAISDLLYTGRVALTEDRHLLVEQPQADKRQ
jgi:hypothetical protein